MSPKVALYSKCSLCKTKGGFPNSKFVLSCPVKMTKNDQKCCPHLGFEPAPEIQTKALPLHCATEADINYCHLYWIKLNCT